MGRGGAKGVLPKDAPRKSVRRFVECKFLVLICHVRVRARVRARVRVRVRVSG